MARRSRKNGSKEASPDVGIEASDSAALSDARSAVPEEPADANRFAAPTGWAAFFWVVAGGVLLGLSQPFVISAFGTRPLLHPLFGLLAFVGWVPLFVVIRTGGPKRAYWYAFTSVFVQMWIILYWLVIAMTVFGKIPIVFSVIATSMLAAAIGFGLAAPFAVAHSIVRHFKWPYWLVASLAATGLELIRSHGPFGGFPWGNLGNSLASVPLFLQGASLFGVYGLLFCIVVVNAGLAETFVAWREKRLSFDWPQRAVAAVMILLVGWGALRLATATDDDAPTVRVALLQGNIEQGIKNKGRQNRKLILDRFRKLQQQSLEDGAEIVVWPEASLPTNVRIETKTLKKSGVMSNRGKTTDLVPPAGIIGGTAGFWTKTDGRRRYQRYNTAFATTKDLKIQGRFDKAHLVPFGEYVPWPLKDIVERIVPASSVRGEGLHKIDLKVNQRVIAVAATICYEGAFPAISRDLANEGIDLFFNVTNDAWYGMSSMTYQHMSMYQMRAVETGRAVARVANTGVSGWVDSRGNVRAQTDVYKTVALVADVPIVDGTTPFRILGEWVALPALLLVLGLWFFAMTRRGIRPRRRPEQGIAIVGGLLVFVPLVLLHIVLENPSEATTTKVTLLVIAGLLVSLGAVSGREWGRRAQMIVGALSVPAFAAGLFLDGFETLPFTAFFIAAGILALKRPRQYAAPQPETAPQSSGHT